MSTETRLSPNTCLACGGLLDAATGLFEANRPSSGDITLCLQCGHIMAFTDNLGFRELTDAEAHAVAGDKRILAAQAARHRVMKKRNQ